MLPPNVYLQYLLHVCPHPVTAGGQTGGQEAPGRRGPVGRGWETPVKLGVASFIASYYPNSSAPQPEYSSERAKDGHPEMTPQVTLFQTQTLINTQRATDHLSTPRLWEKGQRINAGEHFHTRGVTSFPREKHICVYVCLTRVLWWGGHGIPKALEGVRVTSVPQTKT